MALVDRRRTAQNLRTGLVSPNLGLRKGGLRRIGTGPSQIISGDFDLNTPEGLLALANTQGGAIAAIAEELSNPDKTIWSSITDRFKKSFGTFINVIGVPSQTVAGILSPNITVKEAIEKDIFPSDLIFGDPDPDASIMQKVGSFAYRTALDILLDPLTYLTLGAGVGLFGVRATSKVPIVTKSGEKVFKALSKEGQRTLTDGIRLQSRGLTATSEKLSKTRGLVGDELDVLLKETIDAPLDIEAAKAVMGKVISQNPSLARVWLDKGGIKFFGQTVLAGQRIGAAKRMIPGFSFVDNLTQPMRNRVHALFNNKVDPTFGKLPEELIQFEQTGRDLWQSKKIRSFKDWTDVARANKLNINEANMLRAAIEVGKIPADERLARAYLQIKRLDARELKELRIAGFAVEELENHFPHVLVDQPIKSIPFKLPPSQKTGALFRRNIESTIDELAESGFQPFDPNVITANVKRSLENQRAIVMKDFTDDVARTFGVTKARAPDGFRSISVKGLREEQIDFAKFVMGSEVEELYFHPAVAKRIEEFTSSVINDEATQKLLENYDKLQNLWKASVTTIFPAFHGRNGISNVFLNYLDIGYQSLSPTNHFLAGRLIKDDIIADKLATKVLAGGKVAAKAKDDFSDLMAKHIFTDRAGYDWSFGELRTVVKSNQVAFSPYVSGAIDISTTNRQFVDAIFPTRGSKFKRIFTAEALPFRAGRRVGQAIEGQARMVNFLANLKKTGDVQLAALRTKQFLFDYQNLTNFEKLFMRRMIPFYTFTRKNLEVQARALVTTPGRVSQQVIALTTLGEVMAGGKLDKEEQAALPDWIKSGIGILKKKKGQTVEILGSLGTPLEQPFQQFQPNALLGSISPILRVPVEQLSGYSFFHEKPLSEVTNAASFDRAPSVVKDFIGYTKVTGTRKDGTAFEWSTSLRPERMHILLNMPPTTRVLTSLRQMTAANVSDSSKILQQLVGLRPFSFDLEQEAARRERELRQRLEKALIDAGVIAKFQRTFIPKP